MTVEEIVERSVENSNADWAAAPQFSFTEKDVITKGGKRTVKTYQVLTIEGSPYNKLLAVNDEKLTPAEAASEQRKLQGEINRRHAETRSVRQKRIAEYQQERRQNHALMQEMVKAFKFKLLGEDTVSGRRCFVLDATPRAAYQPTSRDTKVLKGMRGKMWIDMEQYQWVKVHAEVFQPVAFGLFIAHVQPGTDFLLEQEPVQGNIWLPTHFVSHVKAEVMVWAHNSVDDETYSGYRHDGDTRAAATR